MNKEQATNLYSHYHHANRLLADTRWLANQAPHRKRALLKEKTSILNRLSATGHLALIPYQTSFL